ncbi:MAG: hypothetical protein A2Y76_06810 [Planctomycetes bacterium RBG_13_60_9]|nr:MAG: hypothetical protein A2Y76_06810 [Planctomycetes bacterium RBG_13_60_9]
MTDTTTQFKKQLPRNLSVQIVSFIVHIGIGIWLVPYLVGHLGRAAYGLIPIAGVMTQYVSLISQNVSVSVNRFLAIALQRNDVKEANLIFNTAFFSYLAIALVQIPIFVLLICCANSIFTIPQELFRDTILLLSCSAMGFLINLVCSVFSVPIYANNRLDISRGIDIGRQVFRVIGIVALFLRFGPALRYVGYVDLAISVATGLVTLVIGMRLGRVLKLSLRSYDWRKVRQLTAMGGWLFVNHVGALLFVRVDIWICNRFVGAEQAGDYAAVLQWSNLIRATGTVMAGVIAPMIIIYYARSEMDRLIRLSQLSVRVLSLALAIPIAILCAFSSSILTVWLGESFGHLGWLMVVMVCPLSITMGIGPVFSINTALNKVKWPGIVTCATGVANLLLAVFLAKYLNWGIYGVAIAGAIILALKNALFTPVYAAAVLDQPWHTFVRSSASGIVFLAGLVGFGSVLNYCLRPTSAAQLVSLCLGIGAVGLLAAWLILSRDDRRLIIESMPPRFQTLLTQLILLCK